MKLRLLPLLVLLVLAQACTTTPDKPDTPAQPEPGTWSYLINYGSSTIGWARMTLTAAEHDGKPAWQERTETYIVIRRSFDGQAFEIKGDEEKIYKADWTPVRETSTMVNGPQTTRNVVTWGEEITIATKVDNNPEQTTTLKPGDKPAYDDSWQAWMKLKEKKLEPGTTLEFQQVDANSRALVDESWTVSGKVKRKLADGTVAEGVEIMIVSGGHAATMIMGDDDQALVYRTATGFTLERTDKIPDPFKADVFELRTVMESDVAVDGDKKLERMEVVFDYKHDDGEGIPLLADDCAYHDVKKLETGYALNFKSQRLSEAAAKIAYPLPEVAEDVSKFLARTPMCQSDDETLAAEAKKLAKDQKTAADVAKAISKFVKRRLKGVSGSTGMASAKQAYDERQGDCTEHAALFVALARAAGLPARNVAGMVYVSEGGVGIFGYHAWAEVWLGEWVPVDATVDEVGTSARYQFMQYDEPGELHGSGRAARCMGQNIHPRINAYTQQGGKSWQRPETKLHFKE